MMVWILNLKLQRELREHLKICTHLFFMRGYNEKKKNTCTIGSLHRNWIMQSLVILGFHCGPPPDTSIDRGRSACCMQRTRRNQ